MFDPLTVAFEIKRPWPTKGETISGYKYYPTMIRIWHKDPCKDGSDNSCDWHGSKRSRFRWHPRWHFWHWRIQIPMWQTFHRWAFERCAICKGHFKWNESVVSNWDGDAIWHHGCHSKTQVPTPNPSEEK